MLSRSGLAAGCSQVDKHEWDGLVRGLLDGKADLVVTSLKITPDRSTAVACALLVPLFTYS